MKKTIAIEVTPEKSLEKMAELQNALCTVQAEITNEFSALSELNIEKDMLQRKIKDFIDLSESRNNQRNITARSGKSDETKLTLIEAEQLQAVRNRISFIDTELINCNASYQKNQIKEQTIISDITALSLKTSKDCLLSLQQKQEVCDLNIIKIKAAIEDQKQILNQNESDREKTASEITCQRENILAECMLDVTKTPENLPIIDITNLNSAVSRAAETIAGLQRKLNEAETELIDILAARRTALERYLLAESEKIGTDYVESAKNLSSNFRRLLALNEIMRDKNFKSLERGDIRSAYIPVFALNSHIKSGESEFDAIYHAKHFSAIESDIQSEMLRIDAEGIQL